MLEPFVKGIPWLSPDSFAVAKQLRGKPFALGNRLATIDLDDFFLSGSPLDISRIIGDFVAGELAILIRAALFFVLCNQFVLTNSCDHPFECKRGSGIGLLHSSHVTNLLFYIVAERDCSIIVGFMMIFCAIL